jgi:hypothetical protein
MNLDEEFRSLVFKYGISNVIEYAENFVKQSYEEIHKIHLRLFVKQSVEAQKVSAPPPKEVSKIPDESQKIIEDPPQIVTEEKIEEPVIKLKKVVRKAKINNESQEVVQEKIEQPPNEDTKDSTVENGSEENKDEDKDADEKKKKDEENKKKEEEKRERNRITKRNQTDAQKKTYEENVKKGINPYDLLTKENLEKWLIKDERTCADIAKNIVGCTDKEVSLAAKRFGIKSLYMGENGMIKAGRKKKKSAK